MKIKLKTLDEVQTFINSVNLLLGYPNKANGTETYCNFPELIEVKENDIVIDSYYEIEITSELQEEMIGIATQKIIQHEKVN